MGTTEKLNVVKEILSTSFMLATEKSLGEGLQFAYKSYPVDEATPDGEVLKSWNFDFLVKELGYGEHVIQQLRFSRPNSIDAKNMEYHVFIEAIAAITQGALSTWYEVGKLLAQDKELQKNIIDEAKKDNISSFESKQDL
jgi:hypothetical protein